MSLTRSQSLKAALTAATAVTSLVENRMYPLVALPPHNQPALIFKFDVDYQYVLSGVEKVHAILEMRSWANDYDVAHALADAVRAVLMPAGQPKGFSGHLGGAGGIKVIQCLIDKESDNLVAVAADQFVFEVVSPYYLHYLLNQEDEPVGDTLLFASVRLSTAQLLALDATPVELVPAPGAGKVIVPHGNVILSYEFGTTPYITGSVGFQFMNGTIDTFVFIAGGEVGLLESVVSALAFGLISDSAFAGRTDMSGAALKLKITGSGGPITAGDGALRIIVPYSVLTL